MIVRWMLYKDLEKVIEIERKSFPEPWRLKELKDVIFRQDTIGIIAEEEYINGFMIYQLKKKSINLINLAVDPIYRRKNIGTELIQFLIKKLHKCNREKIIADVRETNLAAQLFLKNLGFRCDKIVKNMYDHSDEDCYQFILDKSNG